MAFFKTSHSTSYSEEFKNVYLDRLFESFPELSYDEVLDRADYFKEKVGVVFGSTVYEISPAFPLSYDTSSIFLHGYCSLFAVAYKELTNIDSFLLISMKNPKHSKWEGHVLSATSTPELWFDVTGTRTLTSLETEYSPEKHTYEIIDYSELVERIIQEDYKKNPLGFLENFEAEFTKRVVELTVEQYLKL